MKIYIEMVDCLSENHEYMMDEPDLKALKIAKACFRVVESSFQVGNFRENSVQAPENSEKILMNQIV